MMELCKICKTKVSDGIYLSDGGVVHNECIESITAQVEKITLKINEHLLKIIKYENEIKKQDSLLFKIISIFSSSEANGDELKKKILKIKEEIEMLSCNLSSLQVQVSKIYDCFLTYPPDWEERKKRVIKRDGNLCKNCGKETSLHLHHIVPLSKGGSNKIENLELLCESCHSKAHRNRIFSGEFTNNETAFSKRVVQIRYAIKNNRKIKFRYKKPSDKNYKQRTVVPKELINIPHVRDNGSTLCVHGYCELRQADRSFALKRMRGLKII